MSKLLDRFGVCASTVCLIHCVATPFVIFFFPSFKEVFNEETHEVFAVLVVGLVGAAVLPHCKKHGHKDIIAVAVAGVALILGAIFFEDSMPLAFHYGLTMIGSIMLILAHLKNIKVRHGNCSHK
ncbi:MAG: MerC domain-containing protein [Bacteriovoracaceae bacterium]|nr:MerC domain-containing protein [Bacteriovoracaceae bacterium]